jgi:hypothetical protein
MGETPLLKSRLLEVRPLAAGDLPAIQGLFEDVFKHDLSDAFHGWKYREGQSAAVGVFRAGKLVAHYAGIGADILLQGKQAKAMQIVDVMVSIDARNTTGANSPFFLAASTFLQRHIGYRQPYLLGYGFPSHRHLRLAQHLNLYAPVGGMTELLMDARCNTGQWGNLRFRWRHLNHTNWTRYAASVNRLWQGMQGSLMSGILVRRDAERLAYRYLRHPHQGYWVWLLESRLTGTPSAIVVLKQQADRLLLMDIVAPLNQMRDTLHLTAAQTSRQFSLPLLAWFSSSYAAQVAPAAARLTTLPISTPANIWTDGPKPADLQDRWWLTAGDTDFL